MRQQSGERDRGDFIVGSGQRRRHRGETLGQVSASKSARPSARPVRSTFNTAFRLRVGPQCARREALEICEQHPLEEPGEHENLIAQVSQGLGQRLDVLALRPKEQLDRDVVGPQPSRVGEDLAGM